MCGILTTCGRRTRSQRSRPAVGAPVGEPLAEFRTIPASIGPDLAATQHDKLAMAAGIRHVRGDPAQLVSEPFGVARNNLFMPANGRSIHSGREPSS